MNIISMAAALAMPQRSRRASLLTLMTAAAALTLGTAYANDHGCDSKAKPNSREAQDVVDTAVGAGNFKTLVAAVKAAGLVEALKGPGPYTVFAPTDEAFQKLHSGTVRSLLQPENREKLTRILTYHVVPGKLLADDVTSLNGAKTLEGGRVRFSATGERVFVNNSQVIKTNINSSNGVIHVIDGVLMPRS